MNLSSYFFSIQMNELGLKAHQHTKAIKFSFSKKWSFEVVEEQ